GGRARGPVLSNPRRKLRVWHEALPLPIRPTVRRSRRLQSWIRRYRRVTDPVGRRPRGIEPRAGSPRKTRFRGAGARRVRPLRRGKRMTMPRPLGAVALAVFATALLFGQESAPREAKLPESRPASAARYEK